MPSFAELLWRFFRRLIHGALDQLRCLLGSPADHVMQATETTFTEFRAPILQSDVLTMRLANDETVVPNRF